MFEKKHYKCQELFVTNPLKNMIIFFQKWDILFYIFAASGNCKCLCIQILPEGGIPDDENSYRKLAEKRSVLSLSDAFIHL